MGLVRHLQATARTAAMNGAPCVAAAVLGPNPHPPTGTTSPRCRSDGHRCRIGTGTHPRPARAGSCQAPMTHGLLNPAPPQTSTLPTLPAPKLHA